MITTKVLMFTLSRVPHYVRADMINSITVGELDRAGKMLLVFDKHSEWVDFDQNLIDKWMYLSSL